MDQDQIIAGLRRENEALREENQLLLDRCLRDYMERAIRDEELSRQVMDEIGQYYRQPMGPWFVCILFFGGDTARQARPAVAPWRRVAAAFGPEIAAYGQPYFLDASGVVACFLNAAEAECEALRETLEAVFAKCGGELGVSHIAMSRASRMEHGPRRLFREAVAASEQRRADSPPVSMERAPEKRAQAEMGQVFALEPRFWRQIQQHAFYEAAVTLDRLIALTTAEFGSLDRALAAVFSRMEVVLLATFQENGRELQRDPEFARLLPAFNQVSTYDELRDTAYDILALLEDRFYTPPETRNKKMPAIEAYIAAHYADQRLSAASIAEEFKISPQYLSKIFKADMGVGIVEYIHRVRIDAAKQLLRDWEKNLEEIAERVGFSNRWVFARAFKEMEGTTPGAYRDGLEEKQE